MTQDLYGKVSIVTGAARGIGAAIAKLLAERGSSVAIVDLIDGSEIVAELQQIAPEGKFASFAVDVRSREQVVATVNQVVADFGRLDVVVNNAGTASRVDLENMSDDIWDLDLSTNLKGTFLFTQAAIYPHMKTQGSGTIINISSISGIMGGPMAAGEGIGRSGPAYAASKGGIIAFTKWVAKEVGVLGITCNTVAPGPIATPMTEKLVYNFDNQAIKRMGTPEEIAGAVAYLASPLATFVTGETIKVCGGAAIG
ncbi:MAG: SDR family oxidoreductase [Microbacteriaceae bacterium]